jgi:hypothetical protein
LVEARASVGKVMGRLGNLGHGPGKFPGKGPPLVELLKFPGLLLRGMGEVSGVVSLRKTPVGGTLQISPIAP